MKTIEDLGEALIGTGKFIWDVLPEPKDEFDVDELANLLTEAGFAICPNCVGWCKDEELQNDGICQECRNVAQLHETGRML